MSFERVHQSRSQSPQSSWSASQFAPRPFPVPEPKHLPSQTKLENQAFQQNKFEATGLQLKEKYGTITPIEQERLGMLQAKMDSFWVQRMERAKAQPNFLEILIRNAKSAQTSEPAVSVQPKLAIGQANDQYEQEADQVAEPVMSMAAPPVPNIQRQAEEEQEEVQEKPLVQTVTPIIQRQEEEEPIQAKCEACEEEESIQRSSKVQAKLKPPSPTPCQPFPSNLEARLEFARLSRVVPTGAATATGCSEVKPVWDTYFATTSSPFSFSKPSSCVVSAAKTDPAASGLLNSETKLLLSSIMKNLPNTLQGITPTLNKQPIAERQLPLKDAVLIKHRTPFHLHPDITYNTPSNAAANIAGGMGINGEGSDIFGDDDREISGMVTIEVATIDSASGMMTGQVRWQPHIHVKDTVDFCPGNLGNDFQKNFTIPMSKLESMGMTRDVPITIDYDLDVQQENFNDVKPLTVPPTPPAPTPPLPQRDSQFRSRRFVLQPTLEACGKGEHRMLRGDSDLEAVKKVQETLSEAKIPVKADGIFGEETEQAVAKFKREHNPPISPSDGVVGPKTSHALDDVAVKHGS